MGPSNQPQPWAAVSSVTHSPEAAPFLFSSLFWLGLCRATQGCGLRLLSWPKAAPLLGATFPLRLMTCSIPALDTLPGSGGSQSVEYNYHPEGWSPCTGVCDIPCANPTFQASLSVSSAKDLLCLPQFSQNTALPAPVMCQRWWGTLMTSHSRRRQALLSPCRGGSETLPASCGQPARPGSAQV